MTTLASSASDPSNPPVYGQPITFTATISLPNAAYRDTDELRGFLRRDDGD